MFVVIPDVGVMVALFGTPLLWAGYFLAIPEINSRILRLFAFVLVALVHLGAGAGMASHDTPYFARAFDRFPTFIVFYFGVLMVSVLTLGALSAVGTRARKLSLS
jgi:hypothetical protein